MPSHEDIAHLADRLRQCTSKPCCPPMTHRGVVPAHAATTLLQRGTHSILSSHSKVLLHVKTKMHLAGTQVLQQGLLATHMNPPTRPQLHAACRRTPSPPAYNCAATRRNALWCGGKRSSGFSTGMPPARLPAIAGTAHLPPPCPQPAQ
jgi:hypothetical protein